MLQPLIHPDDPDMDKVAACTKACYDKHLKQIKKASKGQGNNGGMTSLLGWEKDGSQDPDDPNTLIKVLLDWITMPRNYANYHGSNANKKKAQYQQKIANKINLSGILAKWTLKQVSPKK